MAPNQRPRPTVRPRRRESIHALMADRGITQACLGARSRQSSENSRARTTARRQLVPIAA